MYKKAYHFFLFLMLANCIFAQTLPNGLSQLKFTENKGQIHSSYFFKADLPNGGLYLMKNKLGYFFNNETDLKILGETFHHAHHVKDLEIEDSLLQLRGHSFSVDFLNSKNATIKGSSPFIEEINYLIGNDPNKWHQHIKNYAKVSYLEIYNEIDFHIFQNNQSLKYEFHVHPEGNFKDIQLKFTGQDSLYIKENELHILTSVNELIEKEPFAYQVINGNKKVIKCEFRIKDGILTYKIGKYNHEYDLIIDPELIFSTSSGSTADNWGNTACLDGEGNLYSGGTVFPTTSQMFECISNDGRPVRCFESDYDGFPSTPGAFNSTFTKFWGNNLFLPAFATFISDMAFMKFNPEGTQLLYATYVGGIETDIPTSINTNKSGELVVLGLTGSDDFPGAINNFIGGPFVAPFTIYSFPNGTDMTVFTLSADGSTLKSRYIGGSNNDGIMRESDILVNNYGDELRGDIILDNNEEIFCVSTTASTDFPVVNGFQDTLGGGNYDAVAFSLSKDLNTINWSTYVGGTGDDGGYSIQLAKNGNIFIAGGTNSIDFPAINGEALVNHGNVDGYVAKLNNNGSALLSSTYIGTSEFDQAYFVQLDEDDDVYLLGQTKGVYPVSDSVYSNPFAGQFIHKLSNDLSKTEYSTVFGSENTASNVLPNISPTAFLVNECENIFVSGWGGKTNEEYNGGFTLGMPLVNELRGDAETDGSDFYLMVMLKDAQDVIFGTYFGGDISEEHVDGGTSRFDKLGIVYQSVCSGCGGNRDFPTFPDDNNSNTFPKRNASFNCNNGVFKYDLSSLEALLAIQDRECQEKTVIFQNNSVGGIDYVWKFGDGDTLFIDEIAPVSHTYKETGIYEVQLIARDITTCTGSDTAFATVYVLDSITAIGDDSICYGEIAPLLVVGGKNPVWDANPDLSCTNCRTPIADPSSINNEYIVREVLSETCFEIDTVVIHEFDPMEIKINIEDRPCQADCVVFQNKSKSAKNYKWTFGDGTDTTTFRARTVSHTYFGSKIFMVTLEAEHEVDQCPAATPDTAFVYFLDSLKAYGDTTICYNDKAEIGVNNSETRIWTPNKNMSCNTCFVVDVRPKENTTYYVTERIGDDCEVTDSVIVNIHPLPNPILEIQSKTDRCYDRPVNFTATISNNECLCCKPVSSYQWIINDSIYSTDSLFTHIFSEAGTHQVKLNVMTFNKISTTHDITVYPTDSCLKNIYVPNAFTPNNDGNNDILYVRGININELEFHLYNRTGEEVFFTNSLSFGWDAIYKGVKQSQQTFVYTCKAVFWDGEIVEFEGNVTLVE